MRKKKGVYFFCVFLIYLFIFIFFKITWVSGPAYAHVRRKENSLGRWPRRLEPGTSALKSRHPPIRASSLVFFFFFCFPVAGNVKKKII